MEAEEHYCIPPLSRIDLARILTLIRRRKYFVLHAPRQTGKTSTLKALADTLNSSGDYHCVYVNVEAARPAGQDVHRAMRAVLAQISQRALFMLEDGFVDRTRQHVLEAEGGDVALNSTLREWARAAERPLVLLIDEIDTLVGDSLLSVLRQLRAGYDMRPNGFPQSVILCGVRDVRDYRVHSKSQGIETNTGSAFNIKAKSLRLGDFAKAEVRSLLGQHAAESGQEFESAAVERIWEFTNGQPWLVNALAYEACFEDEAGCDRSQPVTAATIRRAKETLILNRVTHLDQLAAKLHDERVRRVVEPLLEGSVETDSFDEDLAYVRDLGLIARDDPVRIANAIYREVIPRQLTSVLQSRLASVIQPATYVRTDGLLNLVRLMGRFQRFFRDHSTHWVKRFGYREAGPQLILQAFLQRLVNSSGHIEREYGLGRLRTDLVVFWPMRNGPMARYVIECKVLRPDRGTKSVVTEGLQQTARYMDASGAGEGHLVIFELRPGKSWAEQIYHRTESVSGMPIHVWGA